MFSYTFLVLNKRAIEMDLVESISRNAGECTIKNKKITELCVANCLRTKNVENLREIYHLFYFPSLTNKVETHRERKKVKNETKPRM